MSVHSITFSQSCWTAIRSQTQQTITTFLACSSALLPASWLCGMWLPLGPLTNASDTCRRCCRRRRCCRCCCSGFRGGIEPPPTQHTTQPSCAQTKHRQCVHTVSVFMRSRHGLCRHNRATGTAAAAAHEHMRHGRDAMRVCVCVVCASSRTCVFAAAAPHPVSATAAIASAAAAAGSIMYMVACRCLRRRRRRGHRRPIHRVSTDPTKNHRE